MLRFFIVLTFILITTVAHTESRIMTIRGVVDWGTDTSGIGGVYLRPGCIFDTGSEIANKVISTCNYEEECELNGLVDENEMLLSINNIRKIDTDKEPSTAIIIDAASWASGVREDIKIDRLGMGSLYISNFHSLQHNNETFFVFDFKLYGYENHTPKELGIGKVRLVKRGDKWYYYR